MWGLSVRRPTVVTNLGNAVDGLVRSRGIEASNVRNSFEMKTKWVSRVGCAGQVLHAHKDRLARPPQQMCMTRNP